MEKKVPEMLNPELVNKIIDSMTEGVFTMDADGKISHWNRSMERISGFSVDEALGQSCQILQCSNCFGKDCPDGSKNCKIFEHGSSEAKECLLRHKDGHDIPVIKNVSRLRMNTIVLSVWWRR